MPRSPTMDRTTDFAVLFLTPCSELSRTKPGLVTVMTIDCSEDGFLIH